MLFFRENSGKSEGFENYRPPIIGSGAQPRNRFLFLAGFFGRSRQNHSRSSQTDQR